MKNKSFLTFSLHGMLLGIDTDAVMKILWLPELTLVEECTSYIAGIINMHGKIVPVMDLCVRFGHAARTYEISDRVIILSIPRAASLSTDQSSSAGPLVEYMGIIVNEVLGVIDIAEENIEPPLFEKSDVSSHPHFLRGQAHASDDLVMIIDASMLCDHEKDTGTKQSDAGYFSPEADQPERVIFHNRALALQTTYADNKSERDIPVAVVSVNNECIGVELTAVREFIKIRNFTAVPCCPAHIAGNMNLRGNVLTLIDICGLLNVQSARISEYTKVIVADAGEFPVGIIIDDILDIYYLPAADIVHVHSSIQAINEKFIKGAVPYGSRMMALLDLPEVLSWDGLQVNEEVQ